MEPIKFDDVNVVYGAEQPEYIPLPAEKRPGPSGEIVTCWELNSNEKMIIQETGKIWLSVLTFGQPLQPLLLTIDKPDVYDKE